MNKKKVLIITYYWPPSGGPGVQRWLKFVKYLPEFNIEPVVYCPENPQYPITDNSLLTEVPKNITVLKQPISEPYKIANWFSKKTKTISKGIIAEEKQQSFTEKLLLYIRGNFFIPDARKNWIKPSVSYLLNYIKTSKIDTVITSGPPHSLHLIGLQLKQKTSITWFADFRDPWTTIGYHKQLKLTKTAQKKHKKLEAKVLNVANQIIVTSNNTKQQFKTLTNKPITVITNGYDTEKVNNVTLDKTFSITHIGSLLSKRNPEVLWRVLSDLVKENKEFSKHFKLIFVGAVGETVLQSIEKFDLTQYLKNVGYVTHKEAIVYQKKSQVLLLVEINSEDTKAIIPGKLFEYMVAHRPILAIGPKHTDVEKIIVETNTGSYFLYHNYNLLKTKILDYFNAYLESSLTVKPIGLQNYSRKNLTKSLSKILHENRSY